MTDSEINEQAPVKPALFSRPMPILIFIVAAVILDQAVKLMVDNWLPLQEMVPVIPMLALYRTYNLGVAFSMLSGMDGWFIVGMRLVIVVFVLWLWRRTPNHRWLAHLGFALIIAGALGNLIDRFLYGHVIDYILFHTETWSFAVFNLADSFITVGAGCVILDELLLPKKAKA
ncbi:signal peptidase II [Rhizobium sp. LEGMi198b]|uniref:signal peptidase II n=1 Tax=unclassified Rhizobium TaxID=2613769 RepID=UPI000CDF555E|nr:MULTISPECIES: signal peptidase II [Rhizobium]AVA20127.1 lipoprotein signal peptidase [Rhizobium sp. NXC24]MDK4740752.1 signal peptidase II [Rhizobium sp. CNPSo 3464]UWU21430.1 signal peptidase II [Rhizobium tropici]